MASKDFFSSLFILIFILAASLMSVHGLSIQYGTTVDTPIPWLEDRIMGFLDFFESREIEGPHSILFMGTSNTELDVDPNQVDSSLQAKGFQNRSYNIGLASFTNHSLLRLAERLREINTRVNRRKFDAVVVDFSPLSSTQRFAERLQTHHDFALEDLECLLLTNTMLEQQFWRDPQSMLRNWYLKVVLECRPPSTVWQNVKTRIWNRLKLVEFASFGEDPLYQRSAAVQKHLWQDDEFHPHPNWNPEKRGSSFFGTPETTEHLNQLFSEFRAPDVAQALLRMRNARMDIYSFQFAPSALQDLVATLQVMKEQSQTVFLLCIPDSPILERSAEARQRLTDAIHLVSSNANVQVLDYTNRGLFQDGDYFDSFHLNLSGRAKLAAALAEDLAARLHLPRSGSGDAL